MTRDGCGERRKRGGSAGVAPDSIVSSARSYRVECGEPSRRVRRRPRRRCRRRRVRTDRSRATAGRGLARHAAATRRESSRNGRPTRRNRAKSGEMRTMTRKRDSARVARLWRGARIGYNRTFCDCACRGFEGARRRCPALGRDSSENAGARPAPRRRFVPFETARRPMASAGTGESGGIGRRTGLRSRRGSPWGFESPLSHHDSNIARIRHPCKPLSRRSASSSAASICPFRSPTSKAKSRSASPGLRRVSRCRASVQARSR